MSNNKDVIILTYSLKNRLFWADIQFTNDSEQKTKLPTGTKYEKNHACVSLTKQSYDVTDTYSAGQKSEATSSWP